MNRQECVCGFARSSRIRFNKLTSAKNWSEKPTDKFAFHFLSVEGDREFLMTRKLTTTLLSFLALAASSHGALVAHFSFDDAGNLGANTGSVATNWNEFSGVTQTTGRFGVGAGSFTAGTSQAWDSDFNAVNLNSFTLSMHVKTSETTAWKDFVSLGTGNNVVFVLEQTDASGVYNYNVGNVGGVNEGQIGYAPGSSSFAVNNGAWHHLGITVSNNTLTLYIDGVNRGSVVYTGSGASSAFQLASRFGTGSRAMTTELDDVAIYNEALTDAQMNWLSSNAAITNPVPEPSVALLGLLGVTGLLRRRR